MDKVIKELETEIALIKLGIEENQKVILKYVKKVSKEEEKFKKKYKYATTEEVYEALESDEITPKEYDKILDFLDGKQRSINELFLDYLMREEKQNIKTLKYLEDQLFKENLIKIARS